MKLTRREHLGLMGSAVALAATGAVGTALAQDGPKTIEVQMLNKDPDTGERFAFKPDLVQANPGDTIKFIPTDPGHNSASTEGMIPEGAESWKGKIGEEISVTLDKEGTYAYHCTPHRTLGMVGLILVGDPSSNFQAVKDERKRGKAKDRYDDIFARAEKMMNG